ncbi:hypothetical protein IQ268_26945 [Oculatella sp. LEGE 06141]|nr:hypothetical protein [Oculatella sp. LEGE 06141]
MTDSDYVFSVTYTDDGAIDPSTLNGNNIRITGPNDFSQLATFVGANGNGSTVTAIYQIAAPGGNWSQAANGTYVLSLVNGQVKDTTGKPVAGGTLTRFAVLKGTNNQDTLTAENVDTIINGFAGNDTLRGGNGNDLLNGGTGFNIIDGGNGNDTVSYATASNGVVVDLTTGTATRPIRIMPLGDSNTRGSEPSGSPSRNTGYRDDLWQSLRANNFSIDFVGSLADGPSAISFDKDHQGHGGFAIKGNGTSGEILPNVTNWLNAAKPDIVLLMAGTNDFLGQNNSAEQVLQELEELIDRIYAWSPSINLFISTVPPIDPELRTHPNAASQSREAAKYNDLIPGLLSNSKYAGKRLTFVDTRGIFSKTDIRQDDGIHLTDSGYAKQAAAWNSAIRQKVSSKELKDTLTNVENVIGSPFADRITGNNGNNVIEGGAGADILTGGGGANTFVYRNVSHGVDTITDFNNDDILRISASGFGGGLKAGVALSSSASPTGVFLRGTNLSAIGSSGNFLYNTANGTLRFDPDGTGPQSAVTIATLSNRHALSINQFEIVA